MGLTIGRMFRTNNKLFGLNFQTKKLTIEGMFFNVQINELTIGRMFFNVQTNKLTIGRMFRKLNIKSRKLKNQTNRQKIERSANGRECERAHTSELGKLLALTV